MSPNTDIHSAPTNLAIDSIKGIVAATATGTQVSQYVVERLIFHLILTCKQYKQNANSEFVVDFRL